MSVHLESLECGRLLRVVRRGGELTFVEVLVELRDDDVELQTLLKQSARGSAELQGVVWKWARKGKKENALSCPGSPVSAATRSQARGASRTVPQRIATTFNGSLCCSLHAHIPVRLFPQGLLGKYPARFLCTGRATDPRRDSPNDLASWHA